jgi:hypothetical protein
MEPAQLGPIDRTLSPDSIYIYVEVRTHVSGDSRYGNYLLSFFIYVVLAS